MPLLCNYYVTYRCNARCSFCEFGADNPALQKSKLADPERVMANLRDLPRLGVRFVDFTGGEPLLHPQLADFLREARRLGLWTSVTTNGLLYPKRAEAIRGLVDLLHLSLDGNRSTHDAIRGVSCHDAVLRSLDLAISLGERPDVLFTVTNETVDQLADVHRDVSAPRGLILIVNPLFAYGSTGGALTDETLDRMVAFARQHPSTTYLNGGHVALRRDGGNQTAAPVCRAASSTVVISPDDRLVLPCYHQQQEQLPIGGRLVDLVKRDERVAWHRQMEGRHDFCQGCAVNCYMEPSFALPTSRYFLPALPSKLRYGWGKLVRQRIGSGRPTVGRGD